MPRFRHWFLVILLAGSCGLAAGLSNAPLLALNAYIEQAGNCTPELVAWNRAYNPRVLAGETARGFYYRVLGNQEWGGCGRPFFKPILVELQKIWDIRLTGRISEAEFDAKEAELINLLFAALRDGANGARRVQDYEADTAARLYELVPARQFFNCTYFGERPVCLN